MRRREFISLLGGAAVWPLAARAQQPAMPVLGFLNSSSPEGYARQLAAFLVGLGEAGYINGRNVVIEYRWAGGHNDRLPAMAADLVRRHVDVIAATSTPAAVAAKAATATIPIVFETGVDPIKIGLVASMNHPGGNVTGMSQMNSELAAKRLGLLHDLIPKATVIALLVNPADPALAQTEVRDLREAAHDLALQVHVLNASTDDEIDAAFATLTKIQASALIVGGGAFLISRPNQLVVLAARYAMPVFYAHRVFVAAGGLISYGTNVTDAYRQAGVYTGRVLKGEKPADMPVLRPTKFELVINLKTAKALGLAIPSGVLAIADEVIE